MAQRQTCVAAMVLLCCVVLLATSFLWGRRAPLSRAGPNETPVNGLQTLVQTSAKTISVPLSERMPIGPVLPQESQQAAVISGTAGAVSATRNRENVAPGSKIGGFVYKVLDKRTRELVPSSSVSVFSRPTNARLFSTVFSDLVEDLPDGWSRVMLPEGAWDMAVLASGEGGTLYAPFYCNALSISATQVCEVEIGVDRGCSLEIAVVSDASASKRPYFVLILERELCANVSFSSDRGMLRLPDSEHLSGRLSSRLLDIENGQKNAVVGGLNEGSYCVRVFPSDFVVEPSEIHVVDTLQSEFLRVSSARY